MCAYFQKQVQDDRGGFVQDNLLGSLRMKGDRANIVKMPIIINKLRKACVRSA